MFQIVFLGVHPADTFLNPCRQAPGPHTLPCLQCHTLCLPQTLVPSPTARMAVQCAWTCTCLLLTPLFLQLMRFCDLEPPSPSWAAVTVHNLDSFHIYLTDVNPLPQSYGLHGVSNSFPSDSFLLALSSAESCLLPSTLWVTSDYLSRTSSKTQF